jgi:hypothetical protein
MKANAKHKLLGVKGGRRSGVGVKPQIAMGLISKFTLNFDQNGQCYSDIYNALPIKPHPSRNLSVTRRNKQANQLPSQPKPIFVIFDD